MTLLSKLRFFLNHLSFNESRVPTNGDDLYLIHKKIILNPLLSLSADVVTGWLAPTLKGSSNVWMLERRKKSRCCQPSIDKSFGRKLFGKQHHIVQILPSTTLLLKFGTKKLKIHSNVPTLQNLLLTTKRSSRAEKAEYKKLCTY